MTRSSLRICIVVGTHLSACPRMVKAADALARAGHTVRVVSIRTFKWGSIADDDIIRRRGGLWKWDALDYRRDEAPLRFFRGALRQRAATAVAGAVGVESTPFSLISRASERAYVELRDLASSDPADLFYGGARALSTTHDAAARQKAKFALDLEDFHSGEVDADNPAVPNGALIHSLFSRVEEKVLRGATFLTVGSDAIKDAYEATYGLKCVTLNNVFSPVENPPIPRVDAPLRLYWFSQMVTPRRGIEDAVRGAGVAEVPLSLTLRGRPDDQFVRSLRHLAQDVAPNLELTVADPVFPDDMVASSQNFDVGLALEQGYSRNNSLAMSNKAFVYIAAGLAVAFTDTEGQRHLARKLGRGAFLYVPGDWKSLGEQFRRWSSDRVSLIEAREAAWRAARSRWNWEHEAERGRLLHLVQATP